MKHAKWIENNSYAFFCIVYSNSTFAEHRVRAGEERGLCKVALVAVQQHIVTQTRLDLERIVTNHSSHFVLCTN